MREDRALDEGSEHVEGHACLFVSPSLVLQWHWRRQPCHGHSGTGVDDGQVPGLTLLTTTALSVSTSRRSLTASEACARFTVKGGPLRKHFAAGVASSFPAPVASTLKPRGLPVQILGRPRSSRTWNDVLRGASKSVKRQPAAGYGFQSRGRPTGPGRPGAHPSSGTFPRRGAHSRIAQVPRRKRRYNRLRPRSGRRTRHRKPSA